MKMTTRYRSTGRNIQDFIAVESLQGQLKDLEAIGGRNITFSLQKLDNH